MIRSCPVSESHKKVMIAGGASAGSVFENKNYVFGLLTPTEDTLTLILKALALRGARTIASLQENTTYTNAVCDSIDIAIEGLNMRRVGSQVVSQDASNETITSALLALDALSADVIVGCE